ncbi:tyrosine-type recombinase/integrase [Bacillus cereus]|uniref:tyrosine-type recombinase/integrase n=2 Tax=Bacillus cereus group TaxID=86661 RepID=UPI0039C4A1E4
MKKIQEGVIKTMKHSIVNLERNLPSSIQSMDEKTLLDLNYQQTMNELITYAEKAGENHTAYFNDIDMVYHFIHYSTNIQDEKQRKEETKKTYLREIITFCKTLTTNAADFDISYEEVQNEGSFLKALKPWNIRKFNDWIKVVPNGRNNESYAVSTLARKLTIINGFLLHLYKNGYITLPLHEHLKKATVRTEDRPNRDLYYEEVQQLLAFYKDKKNLFNYMIILFLSTTGLRIREVANAKIGDLYKADGKVWLHVVGKGNKPRDTYISQHLFDCICEYRKRKGLETNLNRLDKDPLLVNNRLTKFNSNYLSNKVVEIINNTDLPFVKQRENPITAHTFRHGFAIIAAENNVELLRIQQTLGHASPHTTSIYLEKHIKRKHNAALSFADSLG